MAKKKRKRRRYKQPKRSVRRSRRRDLMILAFGFWVFAVANHALPTLLQAFLEF